MNFVSCENNGYVLKKGDVIAVRGLGKMVYQGVLSESKKGKLRVSVKNYQ